MQINHINDNICIFPFVAHECVETFCAICSKLSPHRCLRSGRSLSNLAPYLRREGLRIKSQKREDAFSPRWRSEGKHPTKWTRSDGGMEDEPPRRKEPRHGSAHHHHRGPRLGSLRWEPQREKRKSSAKWTLSASHAQLETNPERRNHKAHHVMAARGWCLSSRAEEWLRSLFLTGWMFEFYSPVKSWNHLCSFKSPLILHFLSLFLEII